jgi:bifunctional ADP-heptose synthase (sugar kinase/adenylyltransferase)
MKKELLQKIIGDIKSVKIAVLGDFCLDAYWFIDESKSEISIETGQMTRPVKQQRYSLGGAGNVTNNITAMGVKDVRAFGVIGPDPFGYEMVKVMKQNGINPKNLLVQEKTGQHMFTPNRMLATPSKAASILVISTSSRKKPPTCSSII